MKFKEKIVLITGSSRGIGKETALQFATEGAIVIVHGPENNQELSESHKKVSEKSPKSIKLACELSDSDAIRLTDFLLRSLLSLYFKDLVCWHRNLELSLHPW